MGLVLWAMTWSLPGWFEAAGWRYLALAGLVAAGAVSYFGLAFALGGVSVAEVKARLRRR